MFGYDAAHMANTVSAKRAHKASLNKRVFNVRSTRTMRTAVKDIATAISGKKKDEAIKMLPGVQKALDKAAKRGVIKKETASRKKSRLAAAIKGL